MNRRRFVRDLGLSAAGLFAVSSLSGCAAGNFGLTRQLAKWNRKMYIVPRVLVYLIFIIIPVYELTLLFDFLLNNTVEFWSGTPLTNAKNETFEKDGVRVVVAHTRSPLRRSVFTHYNKDGKVESVSDMRENKNGMIDVYVNGEKKAELKSISEGFAQVTAFRAGTALKTFTVQEKFVDVAYVRAQIYPNSVVASN